jgi:PAS domain-containing protein
MRASGDNLRRCLDSYISAFERREPFVLEYLRHRSGACRWILDHGTPEFSSDGTFLGYIGGAIDTHDRKRAEDALRQSEDRFRLLAEAAPDYASFVLEPEGRITRWNPGAEHVKGYRTEEIIGQYFACFYPREDVDRGKPEQILRIAD